MSWKSILSSTALFALLIILFVFIEERWWPNAPIGWLELPATLLAGILVVTCAAFWSRRSR